METPRINREVEINQQSIRDKNTSITFEILVKQNKKVTKINVTLKKDFLDSIYKKQNAKIISISSTNPKLTTILYDNLWTIEKYIEDILLQNNLTSSMMIDESDIVKYELF